MANGSDDGCVGWLLYWRYPEVRWQLSEDPAATKEFSVNDYAGSRYLEGRACALVSSCGGYHSAVIVLTVIPPMGKTSARRAGNRPQMGIGSKKKIMVS